MSEETLSDILERIKSGGDAPYDELRFALLALESLYLFLEMDVKRMIDKPKFYTPQFVFEENFRRSRTALQKPPKEWVGWENNPDNPEYQARRRLALKIVDKLIQKGEQP